MSHAKPLSRSHRHNRTRGRRCKIDRAEALRRSMLVLMATADESYYAHPLFWAPFVIIGESVRRWGTDSIFMSKRSAIINSISAKAMRSRVIGR